MIGWKVGNFNVQGIKVILNNSSRTKFIFKLNNLILYLNKNNRGIKCKIK